MKKKTTFLLVAIIVVLFGALVTVTYAWLTDQGSQDRTYTIGDISYTITEDIDDNIIVPNQELLTENSLQLTNLSNVASNIRILIAFSVEQNNAIAATTGYTLGTTAADHIVIALGEGWEFDATDNMWYYGTKVAPTRIETGSNPQNPLTSFKFNGALIGNDHSGLVFNFTITFQAKQADHATWEDLAEINFTTGLAN